MKRLPITAAIVLCAMFCNAQNNPKGYASFAAAWTPGGENRGWLSCQLTVGRQFGSSWYVEYNQIVTLSPAWNAPKIFQLRSGPQFIFSRALTLRPFAGYSLTSVPKNEQHGAGHSVCIGAYLLQDLFIDNLYVKYEVSINNNFLTIPSIGVFGKF